MDVWFIRSNGVSGHCDPAKVDLFVPGQPTDPVFNYRLECLAGGFARLGWSASGDIRQDGWRMKTCKAYGMEPDDHVLRYLEQFSSIKIGDLILMPADSEQYTVHLGVVGKTTVNGSSHVYRYHHDASTGDWFENAHRVPVAWLKNRSGDWATVDLPNIGGGWTHAFSRVIASKKAAIEAATALGATDLINI